MSSVSDENILKRLALYKDEISSLRDSIACIEQAMRCGIGPVHRDALASVLAGLHRDKEKARARAASLSQKLSTDFKNSDKFSLSLLDSSVKGTHEQ